MSVPNQQSHMMLDYLVFPEKLHQVEFTVFGLHGRDANKYAFFPFVRQMGFIHTKWILPSATYASETSDEVRRWFDPSTNDLRQIVESRRKIARLIDEQIAGGVRPENIFFVGFSQGAIMGIDTALRYPKRLGGIVALSGYIAHPDLLARERSEANRRIPIFIGHGKSDNVLTIEKGRENEQILKSLGYDVTYYEYDTAHRICSEEVRHIREFLHRHMYGLTIEESARWSKHTIEF